MPRRISPGDEYKDGEDIELAEPPRFEEPPVEIQGEPWGWSKAGPKPRGWPGPDKNPRWHNPEDPGPFDGRWGDDE